MTTRRRFLAAGLALAAVAMLSSAPARAAAAKHPSLSERDRADIASAENYLNAVKSLKARFLQISDNGAQAEGMAYLARPGHLRLQYDPPSPLLVVADGHFLIVQDKTLDNPSWIPLDSTPAGILVRSDVTLDGKDLMVTKVKHLPGVVEISVVQANDTQSGDLTLVFSDAPFQLRQWRVTDAQGLTTTVSLFDMQTGIPLDAKLFEFRDTKFLRPNI